MRTYALALLLVFLGACGGTTSPGADARLSTLGISTGTLSPAFDPEILDYTVGPGLLDDSVTVIPTALDATASITVDGSPTTSGSPSAPMSLPVPGVTSVEIVVTSPDGATRGTYTIQFMRDVPSEEEALVEPGVSDQDEFGTSIGISGDTLVVGSPFESSASADEPDDNSLGSSGAAYVYVREGATWTRQAVLKAGAPERNAAFGDSLAISGDTIVVGARGEGANGAAYVFVRTASTWSQEARLEPSKGSAGDQFGAAVAISGNTIVVGARSDDGNAQGVPGDEETRDSGAAYVFVRTGSTWDEQAYLKASNFYLGDSFGQSVAVSGSSIVVGAPFEDSAATGVDGDPFDNSAELSGAAYVFEWTGSAWSQTSYLKASDTTEFDEFGYAVDIADNTIVVGARNKDGGGGAYAFRRVGETWAEQARLVASNRDRHDAFGTTVAVSHGTIVVGAHEEESGAAGLNGDESDNSASAAGAAYVFMRVGDTWSQQVYIKPSNPQAGGYFGFSVSLSEDRIAVGASAESASENGTAYIFR